MKHGLVLMSACPPTKGHAYLIEFARRYLGAGGHVTVLVGHKKGDPISGKKRVSALHQAASRIDGKRIDIVSDPTDSVPDRPDECDNQEDFWRTWRDRLSGFGVGPTWTIFASELYGARLASDLGCDFVPCNRYRETIDCSASAVRADPLSQFSSILHEFQHRLRRTVTLFGAESCGKTTLSKRLAAQLNAHYAPEWAREYLETVGSEITEAKMTTICRGQEALQSTVHYMYDKPFVVQDTDLLSTLGYYRIWGREAPANLVSRVMETRADLYVVMNSRVPFAPDPLRYGGSVRESTDKFWLNLLDEFGFRYHYVESTDPDDQFIEVREVMINLFKASVPHWNDYKH